MKANEIKITDFLAGHKTTFAIPVYQRNYDWTVKECQQLFNDIIRIGSNDDNAHFIGSIVYVHDDVYSATQIKELIIIDGQQRLTTITLIFSVLYCLAITLKKQNHIYKNYWEVIERNAKDEMLNISMVSDFIRDFLTLKNKKIPNKKDVYAKFKQKYPTATLEELESVLQEQKSLVTFYNKLLNPKNETDTQIKRQLKYINQIEINVAYPFLMKVYEDYGNEIIDKQTFIAVLELIQSFVWRRFIVGLPTNALNKIFMSLYERITVEHIFPQNPDPKWKFDLKEEYDFIKDNYLNTIGNLTLSGNNGKLSNKPFVEKRDMNIDGGEQGYKFSRLWLI